jgi:putative hydrolase of the HAD superfamily
MNEISNAELHADEFSALFFKYAAQYLPHHTIMANILHDLNIDRAELAEQLVALYESCMQQRIQLFPGALETLGHLSQDYALGAISNAPAKSQKQKLIDLKIDRFFEHVIISSEVGVTKPEPDIFWHATRLFGLPPSAAVYVGNDPILDIEGARRAGLFAIWINIDGANLTTEVAAHAIVTDLRELPGAIRGLDASIS